MDDFESKKIDMKKVHGHFYEAHSALKTAHSCLMSAFEVLMSKPMVGNRPFIDEIDAEAKVDLTELIQFMMNIMSDADSLIDYVSLASQLSKRLHEIYDENSRCSVKQE